MALDLFRVSAGIQIDDSIQILEGAGIPLLDAPVGSTYSDTLTGGLYTKVLAGAGASNWEILALNSFVVSEIATVTSTINAMGAVFNYVGTVAGGSIGTPTNLSLLATSSKNPGDYHKVSTPGYFSDGVNTIQAATGDGLVWNTVGQIDKIDNTNSIVLGTTNEIAVVGDTNTGFTVSLDTAFSTRISTAETTIIDHSTRLATAEGTIISNTGRITTAENNITNLQAEDGYINAFIGKATGNDMPLYTSALHVTQGGDLELAIGELDAVIGAPVVTDVIISGTNTVNGNITALSTYVASQVNMAVTTLNSAVPVTSVATGTTAKWLVRVVDTVTPSNTTAYEIFATADGTLVDFTKYGILRLGTNISGLSNNVTSNGTDLTLSIAASVNISVTVRLDTAF